MINVGQREPMTDLVLSHRRRMLDLYTDWILAPNGRVWALSGGSDSQFAQVPQGMEVLGSYFTELRARLDARDGASGENAGAGGGEPGVREYKIGHGGLSWRVTLLRSSGGWHRMLRYMPEHHWDFRTLGFAPGLVDILLDRRLQNGLVVFTGASCSGKTTSALGYIREMLCTGGGHAITLEDPPEQELEGLHGDGYLFQIETTRERIPIDLELAERYGSPRAILIGELRSGPAVTRALEAGLNGQLIVSTFHASGMIEALERMRCLAMETGLSERASNDLMARSIAAVVYQRLLPKSEPQQKQQMAGIPRARRRMALSVNALLLAQPWASHAVRAQVGTGQFHLLVTEMESQARMLGFPPPC